MSPFTHTIWIKYNLQIPCIYILHTYIYILTHIGLFCKRAPIFMSIFCQKPLQENCTYTHMHTGLENMYITYIHVGSLKMDVSFSKEPYKKENHICGKSDLCYWARHKNKGLLCTRALQKRSIFLQETYILACRRVMSHIYINESCQTCIWDTKIITS